MLRFPAESTCSDCGETKVAVGNFYDRGDGRPERRCKRKATIRGNGGSLTSKEWNEVVDRFGGRCAYCLGKPEKVTIDHITALSRGGRHDVDNVVPACATCNFSKHTHSLLGLLVSGKAA